MSLQPQPLAQAIEEEMDRLYTQIRGTPLPSAGAADRQLLFLAIARGILRYLEENQRTAVSSIKLQETGVPLAAATSYTVTDLDLNIVL